MSLFPSSFYAHRPGSMRHRLIVGGVVAALIAPGFVSSSSAQSVESLQAQAKKIAAELETMDERTNELAEDFNAATVELEAMKARVAENATEVTAAEAVVLANQTAAKTVAIQAFVGTTNGSEIAGFSTDIDDVSRRKTYLASVFGDSDQVIEQMTAAQQDLNQRAKKLAEAQQAIDSKLSQITQSKSDLEATIAKREALFASVSGELAAAMEKERQRIAAAAEAKAQAEARAAAARAAAARRPQAVGGRAATSGAVPVAARSVVPVPAGATKAVQVAMEQQGDPYRWAASGPNSFDCSGLVMFAYAATGRSLPHSSRSLRAMTQRISEEELQPGDLVFGGSPVHHVGIYIGGGQMVHAPHSGDVVKVSGIYKTSKPVSFGRL